MSLFGESDAGLFDAPRGADAPLAERVRPAAPDAVFGQDAVLAPGTLLGDAMATGSVPSLVLYGPPGTGKTTLARLLARRSDMAFAGLSAVTSGVKDVRVVIKEARTRALRRTKTLLFVDEIHRFNRAQQDAFLPHIEDGTIVLVGATTENPGFSLIGALLSRVHVVTLASLDTDGLEQVAERALELETGLAGRYRLGDDARVCLFDAAGGDARKLLNLLEAACQLATTESADDVGESPSPIEVGVEAVRQAAQTRALAYARSGDDRYDLLSALHKSLRGSDVDAALYWMARMLVAAEDPLVIVRRLVSMAAEDIGLADPRALRLALDAKDAVQFLGVPEGELALAEAVIYLATAPKSNSVVLALKRAKQAAADTAREPVPLHLRNAPTRFARDAGHGSGYRYPHDFPNGVVAQAYLPASLERARLYIPKPVGEEREVEKRLLWWRRQREESGRVRSSAPEDPA